MCLDHCTINSNDFSQISSRGRKPHDLISSRKQKKAARSALLLRQKAAWSLLLSLATESRLIFLLVMESPTDFLSSPNRKPSDLLSSRHGWHFKLFLQNTISNTCQAFYWLHIGRYDRCEIDMSQNSFCISNFYPIRQSPIFLLLSRIGLGRFRNNTASL